jgi:ATP-binding cassette, subfamily B, bacterial PglK
MLNQIGKIYLVMDRPTRLGLIWVFALMLVAAILEMVGLGLFIPLLQILISPEKLSDLPLVGEGFVRMSREDNATFVVVFCISLFAFFIFKSVMVGWIIYAQQRFVLQKRAIFAQRLMHNYLIQPYVFHLQRNTAELVRNVINLSAHVFIKGLMPLLQLTMDIIITIGMVSVLLLANPQAALIMGSVMAVSAIIFYRAIRNRVKGWGDRIVGYDGEILLWANQALGSIKETKIRGAEQFFADAFGRPNFASVPILSRLMLLPHVPRLFLEIIAMGGMLLLVVTLVVVNQQDVTTVLPALGLFAVAAMRLMPTFSKVVTNLNILRGATAGIDIIHDDFRDYMASGQIAGEAIDVATQPLSFKRDLCLKGVSFDYPGSEQAALSDINLTLQKGQSVAFVGRSGAGKTSLVDIILGLLQPSKGRLLVDDRDIFDNLASWQGRIGYIPQEIYLTDDTFRRNIALGVADADIDDDKVRKALRLAQLDDVLNGLPDGLGAVVGERGARLSGGQRQRIGIARALYNDPEILVMDEATSALDSETERQVSAAIDGLSGQKTLIIIAHRLSTVRHCDQIVLLENGKIVGSGSFADLAAQNAEFNRMIEISDITLESV